MRDTTVPACMGVRGTGPVARWGRPDLQARIQPALRFGPADFRMVRRGYQSAEAPLEWNEYLLAFAVMRRPLGRDCVAELRAASASHRLGACSSARWNRE